MKLIYKEVGDTGRSMYIVYPKGECRNAFKRVSITVLRDGQDEASVKSLLVGGLWKLAQENDAILCFPNPVGNSWNYKLSGEEDDAKMFPVFQEAMLREENRPAEKFPWGIPTAWEMMNSWHVMHDTRYLIGLGSGANMACTLAACYPDDIAAVLSNGGNLCEMARHQAVYAPIPIWLVDSDTLTRDYFVRANEAVLVEEKNKNGYIKYKNADNPLQCVTEIEGKGIADAELINQVWKNLFCKVRRTRTSAHGDCVPRMDLKKAGIEALLDNMSLDEHVRVPHTWFVHVPEAVRNTDKKVPLVLFFHGGSDNPGEAAEMSGFHQLGEEIGFITVYPWATNKRQWNNDADPNEDDDLSFSEALIRYMCNNYPVDTQRVYLSGFSNGAAHAQVVAMTYPELVAAICPIDTRWPGDTTQEPQNDQYEDNLPMYKALEKQKRFHYQMPVWYTYGTLEHDYPVVKGNSQQRQYDFWKKFNNIEIKPTPEKDAVHPCGCGVPGEVTERIQLSGRFPHHHYDIHRFYTKDDAHLNLYNYVLMHDKKHEVAWMDTTLGWNYVKQFRRLPDGSLGIISENK